MFDDKQQTNNGNLDKDINLLPEKMRTKEPPKAVGSGKSEQTRYTTPSGLSTPVGYEKISWWQKLLGGLSGKNKSKLDLPVNRNLNQGTPLQKLYAQDIRQTDKKSKNNLPPTPQATKKLADFSHQPTPATKMPEKNLAAGLDQSSDSGKPLSVLEKIDQQLQRGLHLVENNKDDSDQFGVNLIPEEMVSEVNKKKILFTLLYTVIISIFILGFGYITIQFIQLQEAKKIQKLQQDIQKAENDFISKSDDLKALIRYQQTYDNINLLLDSHIYWDKLFNFLEQNVADDVYFLNVTADKNGVVNMSIVAKSYEALANQYLIFKQAPEVISVNINNASLSENGEGAEGATTLSIFEPTTSLSAQSTSTATSTAEFDLRSVVLDHYKKMPVSSQVNLQLDTNIFYRDN